MRLLIFILLSPFVASGQIISASPSYRVTASAASFSPKDVSGLVRWVYADTLGLADNDPVSSWTDLSGSGDPATQSGTLRPLYKTNIQNGRDIIRFDGSDDFMEFSATNLLDGLSGATFFLVVAETSLNTNKALLCKWDYSTQGTFAIQTSQAASSEMQIYVANACTDAGGNYQNTVDASLTAAFYLWTVVYDGSQATNADRVKFYRNGTLLTPNFTSGTFATTFSTCTATLKIGSFGGSLSRNYDGDVGEIAVYNTALGTTDRQNVENYLKAHWGL